jgi:hypothetical protein
VNPEDAVRPEEIPIQFTRLAESPLGPARAERLVIRDAGTFRRFWQNVFPGRPLPEVSFPRELVLVAAMGGCPNGGYWVRIERVALRGDLLIAEVSTTFPGPSCVVTGMPTLPIDVVKVRNPSRPVRFSEATEVTDCEE